MQKFILANCLVAISMLGSHPLVSSASLYPTVAADKMRQVHVTDRIILKDGTQWEGLIELLPSLVYPFGHVEFNPYEIRSIYVTGSNHQLKVHYATQEGQNFVGTWPEESLSLLINDDPINPSYFIPRKIPLQEISYILLQEEKMKHKLANKNILSLTFQNGDHLPILILSDAIQLTNGWINKSLASSKIKELHFNGGLYGKIIEEGLIQDLNFHFVKDRYLTVQIFGQHQALSIPWDKIASIQADQQDFRQIAGVITLNPPLDYLLDSSIANQLIASTVEEVVQQEEPSPNFNPAILQEIVEANLFESIQRVEIEPEEFEYASLLPTTPLEVDTKEIEQRKIEQRKIEQREIEQREIAEVEALSLPFSSQLSPQALAIIRDILQEEEQELDSQHLNSLAYQHQVKLKPEAIAMIEEILANDELDEFEDMAPLKKIGAIVQVSETVSLAESKVEINPALISTKHPLEIFWKDHLNMGEKLNREELALINELLAEDKEKLPFYSYK